MATIEENVQSIRRYWTEAWSEGDLDAIADLYHPNCIHGENFTIEGFQRKVSGVRTSFPDFAVQIDDVFGVGDKVVSRITYRGTHMGTFAGMSPSERKVEFTGMDIFHIRDGKIVEHWHEADHYTMFEQLGVTWVTPEQPEIA